MGFAGCNLTIPHKEAALEIVDEIDMTARRAGAVNTIVVGPHGRLSGRNTDMFGFTEALREDAPGWRADAGPAVVIGAGGAARAVVAALIDDGAAEIRLVNRTPARAASLAKELGGKVAGVAVGGARRRARKARRCSSMRRASAWKGRWRSICRSTLCRARRW